MNEEELYRLLNGLRILKQKGELDTDEKLAQQTVKWRNTLEYSVLETCIRHYSDKVTIYLELTVVICFNKKIIYIINNIHFQNLKGYYSQVIKKQFHTLFCYTV